MSTSQQSRERRTLVLLTTPRDNQLACQALAREGVDALPCRDPAQLLEELHTGAGCVLIGEEWLARGLEPALAAHVASQPQWSDLPILLLARTGADSPQIACAVAQLGNVTVLERPIRLALLVTATAAAARARARQYELRHYLDTLAQARNELAAIARAKDEFLATLAHELRNPLAPMRTGLAVLSDTRTTGPARDDLHAMLGRQVDHMVRLVDDLIDLSRLNRGSMELHVEPVDIADIVRDAVDLSRPLIDGRQHALVVDIAPGAIVEADRVRMTQVVTNLLNNAAKYSPPNGHVAIMLARRDGEVALSVRDRGYGIDADMLPHVFEMFTQGRDREHRAQDGLGVGLSLVRQLVELHGGRVTAHSEGKGRGACFEIVLPASVPGRTALPRTAPSALVADGGRALRVLVVDDNVDAGATLGMALDLMDIAHRVVTSGADALAALHDGEFDAVLLDIGMPGMDGYEVARRIRAEPATAHVHLIALTGWGQADDTQRTRLAGFDHHLTKPMQMDTLMRVIEGAGLVPQAS